MLNKINKLAYLLFFLAIIGLAGCKDKETKLQKPVVQKPKTVVTETSKLLQKKEEIKVEREVYTYDPKGRRDPFMSLVDLAKTRIHMKKNASPIENFDVTEIKVTAIVWDDQQYFGMVTLPNNKSYTITKGMPLGLYGGKVEEITEKAILIRERVKDYKGRLKTKDTILRLREEEEE